MAEVLEIVLSDVWHWMGTLALIYVSGHAVSAPFFWICALKRLKREQKGWRSVDN